MSGRLNNPFLARDTDSSGLMDLARISGVFYQCLAQRRDVEAPAPWRPLTLSYKGGFARKISAW